MVSDVFLLHGVLGRKTQARLCVVASQATMPSLSSNTMSVSPYRPESTPAPARRLLYTPRSLPTQPSSRQTVVVVVARLVATRRMPNSMPYSKMMCSFRNASCSGASCLDRILNASAQNVAVAATRMYLS